MFWPKMFSPELQLKKYFLDRQAEWRPQNEIIDCPHGIGPRT